MNDAEQAVTQLFKPVQKLTARHAGVGIGRSQDQAGDHVKGDATHDLLQIDAQHTAGHRMGTWTCQLAQVHVDDAVDFSDVFVVQAWVEGRHDQAMPATVRFVARLAIVRRLVIQQKQDLATEQRLHREAVAVVPGEVVFEGGGQDALVAFAPHQPDQGHQAATAATGRNQRPPDTAQPFGAVGNRSARIGDKATRKKQAR